MNLTSYLHQKFALSIKSAQLLADKMTIKTLAKGEVFVKTDQLNSSEYIVMDGIIRSYILDIKDKDITLSFFTENTAISPNVTRSNDKQSILNLQALSTATIATFSSSDLNTLMMANREIEQWANQILQAELLRKVKKEINQISLDAKERLVDFRNQYPPLENLIPHSYISSYLGITTVSLSRLRKELSLKK